MMFRYAERDRANCAMCSKVLSMEVRALWHGRARAHSAGRAFAHERAFGSMACECSMMFRYAGQDGWRRLCYLQ